MSRRHGSLWLRSRLGRELRRVPRAVAGVAELGRRAGATRQAERLERAGGMVVVTPPSPGAKPLRMLMCGDTDQIARTLRDEGWHAFEAPLPDVFAAIARRRPGVVLDVGANSGFYTLLAVSVAPGIRVHAFEPFPPATDALRANLRLNRAANVVTVVDKALSDHSGIAQLFVPDAAHGQLETSASLNSEFSDSHAGAGQVAVTRLDDHLEACGNPSVSLLKVDVESLEHRVLAGAEKLLTRDRPPVTVEVLPGGDLPALEQIRRQHGYVDVRLRPEAAVVGEEVRFDPEAWNHLWVPAAELDRYVPILEGCGLSVGLAERPAWEPPLHGLTPVPGDG